MDRAGVMERCRGVKANQTLAHVDDTRYQKALLAAQKSLADAQKDLNNTVITAPFDSLIISRNVSKGSFVRTDAQWQLFSPQNNKVTLTDNQTMITAPKGVDSLQIVLHPLAPYKPGMKVQTKQERS
jgi:multidrug efflux pump subunit AcrA (membrane-fusion protein)